MGIDRERREPRRRRGRGARAERGDERRDQRIRRREDREIGRRQRLVVHVPAVVHVLIDRALDDLGARQRAAAGLQQRAAEVDPVEAQDHVRVADEPRRIAGHVEARRKRMQRMARRKRRAGLDVAEYDGADAFRQRDAPREIRGIARHAADHDERRARVREQVGDFAHRPGGRVAGNRDAVAVERGQRHRRRQRLFLQRGVERHVDGPLRQRRRDSVGAQDRLERGRHRSGLVVPFRVAAHQRTQVARRMDPVDPRPALHRVDRSDARPASARGCGRTTR